MSTLAIDHPHLVPSAPLLSTLREDEPRFYALAVLLAVSTVPTVAAMLVDQRTLLGDSVWVKPLKFQIALVIYLLTLACGWYPSRLATKVQPAEALHYE